MSTVGQRHRAAARRTEGWGQVRILRAPPRRYTPDASEIARTLIDKYGAAALSCARERGARAVEIHDELALEAWRSVIEATKQQLSRAGSDPGL
jgi:hypothetical protein